MAKNQYITEKLPKYLNGKDIYVVRNRSTGSIKYSAYLLYLAQDLTKFANGRLPNIAMYTGFLAQSHPAHFGIPCEQIEA